MLGRSALLTSLLGSVLVALLFASTRGSATPPGVDLVACDGATRVVDASTEIPLVGPTFTAPNKGLIDVFLSSSTTTLSVNGVDEAAGTGWSAPAARDDATLGR